MKRFSKILITAGPTREKIDDVRFITNLSTGNMGYELARAARRRGYKVTLISGPTGLKAPKGVRLINTLDARAMGNAVKRNIKGVDCLFMASAVCDWRPEKAVTGKIKKNKERITLKLVRNADILKGLGRKKNGALLVGFALESKDLLKSAKRKLKDKNLDLIAANRVGSARNPFGSGRTDITVIDRDGKTERLFNITKKKAASRLLDNAERLWGRRG